MISTIDLGRMARFHRDQKALATLAVERRETSRYLVFDEHMRLRGRRPEHQDAAAVAQRQERLQDLAFSGIHIISPRLLGMMTEEGAFSIITTYLRLASLGDEIVGFEDGHAYWRDLGRPESIERAAEDLKQGRWSCPTKGHTVY